MAIFNGQATLYSEITSTWEVKPGIHCWLFQHRLANLHEDPYHRACHYQELPPKDFDWADFGYARRAANANAILIPIPLKPDIDLANDVVILEHKELRHILGRQMESLPQQACTKAREDQPRPLTCKDLCSAGRTQVVKTELHEILLVQHPLDALEQINQISEVNRPLLDRRKLQQLAIWYPDWSLAVACFSHKEIRQHSFAVIGPTKDPNIIFQAAIQQNDGTPPDLARVILDEQSYLAGSCLASAGEPVEYRGSCIAASELKDVLPPFVVGERSQRLMTHQGDMVALIEDVRNGIWQPQRLLPPGAPQI